MKKICLAALILVSAGAFAPLAHAQGGGGVTALPFFLEPMDPARAALGGSYSTRSGDAASAFVNPAGAWNAASEAYLGHTEFEQGLRLECVALAIPADFGGAFTLGAGFAHLGTLQNLDENGNAAGADVSYGATIVRLGYGRPAGPRVSWGVGVEFLNQGIAGVSSSAFGLSLGAIVRGDVVDVSGAVDHVGTSFHAEGGTVELPRSLHAGLRLHSIRNLEVLGELSHSGSDPAALSGGLEWKAGPVLAVRAGYHRELSGMDPVSGLSGGVGLGLGTWSAEYGLTQGANSRPVHRFGLKLALGALGSQP